MMNTNFDYEMEKQILQCYEQEIPELTPFLQNYWKNRTRFTMPEIIPTLNRCLSNYYNDSYIIQCRYILTEKPFIQIFDGQKRFHLSLEYYGIPTNECYTFPDHTLPSHIFFSGRLYRYEQDFDHNVILKPMDNSEIHLKNHTEQLLESLKKTEKLIWIGTEERDIDTEELLLEKTWMSEDIPIEERNMNKSGLILNGIIQYIEKRENSTLSSKMSDAEINSILNDFFQNRHQK